MPPFLDTEAILLATIVARLSVVLGLTLYERYQRTCPGFSQWVSGMGVGVLARVARQLVPAFPVTGVVLTTQLQTLTSLLILDGVFRYVLGRRLDRRWYALPVAGVLVTALLARTHHQAALGGWVAVVVGAITLVGGLTWLRPGPPEGRVLRWAGALVHFGFVFLVLVRVLAWTRAPGSWELTGPGSVEPLFYLAGGVLDMTTLALFVMLNARRLEDELLASTRRLQAAVADLQQSRDRVRILTGILPICSECKNIRDEEGHWTPVEQYMGHRTDARFSRGVCPSCVRHPDPSDPAPGSGPALSRAGTGRDPKAWRAP